MELGPRAGDLGLPVALSAPARARAGQRVHTQWQQGQREAVAGYTAEVVVRHTLTVGDWTVTVHGRVDGLIEEGEHRVVEEVKSVALPAERLMGLGPDDVPDWSFQLEIYLYLLEQAGHAVVGRLVLISLFDGTWRILQVLASAATGERVQSRLAALVAEREARLARNAQRRAAPVPFPHEAYRPGQEELISLAQSALLGEQHLLIRAPTGLGKTALALTAALRVAAATGRRVYYATARGTQQRLAEQTLLAMVGRGLPVRAITLRAREKVCLNDVVLCRPESCRYASGYYDKVQGLLHFPPEPLTPDAVVALGQEAVACPYALSVDLAERADVVIGDYNYLFDPAARQGRLFREGLEGWIAVVDEAHNLPERAMGYQSPALPLRLARASLADLPEDDDAVAAFRDWAARVERWLSRGYDRVGGADPAAWGGDDQVAWEGERVAVPIDGDLRETARELADEVDALALPYALWRYQQGPAEDDPWLDLARGVLRLRSAVERAGEETLAIWTQASPSDGGLQLLCRDPASLLRPIFEELSGSLLMSATLDPPQFYRDLLGLEPGRVLEERVGSPFPPERRRVLVVPGVTTAYKHRVRDRDATAALITEALAAVPGNAAVYFSSFSLLDDLVPLIDVGDKIRVLQGRSVSEADRAATLDLLAQGLGHVLMAVLGGVYAEGVDLPGAGLLAAIIVGTGLPQVNLERRLLQAWFEERYGQGARYAYQVPGLTRVVQAAGRVIRTPEDRGAIVLVDRRFLLNEVTELLPEDWAPVRANRPGVALAGFWDAPLCSAEPAPL